MTETVKATITEALAELKTIEKRIFSDCLRDKTGNQSIGLFPGLRLQFIGASS